MVFSWTNGEVVEKNEEIVLPEHILKETTQKDCTSNYSATGDRLIKISWNGL